jgi:capsular polysaccharide biosynthesis protein
VKRTNRIVLAEGVPAPSRHGTAEEMLVAVRTRWPVIVMAIIVTALAAWLIGTLQPKRYRASAFAAIVPLAEKLGTEEQIRATQALDQRTIVATVAALVSMPVITGAAITPADRGYDLRAVVLPNTNVLRVEVDGPSPARAAAIANAIPGLLSARTGTLFGLYGVKVVSPAGPADLIFPRMERILAAGLVIGLIIGLTLAWLLTAMRRPAAATPQP